MFTPLGNKRGLVYPLKNQVSNENLTDPILVDPLDFIWPTDSAERTLLPLWISLDEWNAINSAVDVGADVAYPLQYVEVINILMRQTRYRMPICSLIIECVMNDEDTKNAIIEMLSTSDTFITNINNLVNTTPPETKTAPIIAGSCDNSVLAGKMIALVDRLDLNNLDALENIGVGTNDEAIVSNIIEGIPLFGELPIDDIIEFGANVVLDFTEQYAAASNSERRDDMSRDLYCYAKTQPDCVITYEGLFEFFQSRATTGLSTLSTIFDIINFIRDGDFDNDNLIFNTMFAMQIAFVNVSRDFYGINLPSIGAITRDASPSSAWMDWALCAPPEGCEGGEYIDFRASNALFAAYFGRALYDSAAPNRGWGPDASAPSRISIQRNMLPKPVRMKITTNMDVAEIRIYNITGGGSLSLRSSDAGGVLNPDGTYTYQFDTFPVIVDDVMIDCGGSSALDVDARVLDVCWNYDV